MARTDRSALPRSGRLDRRSLLTAGAALSTAALSGCAAVADFLAGFVLKHVNVINGTDRPIAGAIRVADPDDDVVLDETFELEASQSGTTTGGDGGGGNDQPDEAASALYGSVFDGEGAYDVTVDLDDGTEFGVGGAEETVEVENPGDEHVFVLFLSEEGADEIVVTVADGFSDLEGVGGS